MFVEHQQDIRGQQYHTQTLGINLYVPGGTQISGYCTSQQHPLGHMGKMTLHKLLIYLFNINGVSCGDTSAWRVNSF